MAEQRDLRFDILKGIAVLLVITGHVMQTVMPAYSETFVFNTIWSLQIPLFMILSGYFSISRKKLSFLQRIINKSIRYLLPAFSYLIISCFIESRYNLLYEIFKTLWHLESSLWYLIVLFFLGTINDITQIFEKKKTFIGNICTHTFIYFSLVIPWLGIWKLFGATFLGAKFVIYYSLYFYIGWLWRNITEEIMRRHIDLSPFEIKIDFLYAISVITWFVILLKVNLYKTEDTILGTLPRVIGSIVGVFVISYLVIKQYKKTDSFVHKVLITCGKYSLELYFIHMLMVNCLPSLSYASMPLIMWGAILIYTIALTVISMVIIKILKNSKLLDLLLFGIQTR